MLDDGTYDAIVVDAADVGAEHEGRGAADDSAGLRLELTIIAGPHKGEVVAVRVRHLALTAVETLGLPARLVVIDQQPEVVLET